MNFKQWSAISWLAGIASSLLLSACGGSGSSTSTTPNLYFLAGTDIWISANTSYSDVHLTFTKVLFNTNASAGPDDAGWVGYVFTNPVSMDFGTKGQSTTNGQLQALLHQIQIPVNNYTQIRLVLQENTSANTCNWVTDSNSVQHPIQIPDASHGWTLRGTFNVVASSLITPPPPNNPVSLQVALNLNLDDDLVPLSIGTPTEYMLKPRLSYINLTQSITDNDARLGTVVNAPAGAIQGTIANAQTGTTVTAELPSQDGKYHQAVLSTQVQPGGKFVLYPIPLSSNLNAKPSTATNSTVMFDLVIHGDGLQTQILRGVPVTPTLEPADPLSTQSNLAQTVKCTPNQPCTYTASDTPSNPVTVVNLTPITLTSVNTTYTADLQPPMAANTRGAWVDFYQTLPGSGEVPYEITYSHVNPYTGQLGSTPTLTTGEVQVSAYAANANPSGTVFQTPTQGSGAYSVVAEGPGFARLAAKAILSAPASGNSTTVNVGALTLANGFAARSIANGTLFPRVNTNLSNYWALAVSDGQVVSALDLTSAIMVLHSANYAFNGLPANGSSFYGISITGWSNDLSTTGEGFGVAFVPDTSLPGSFNLAPASANLTSTDAKNIDLSSTNPFPLTLLLP